MIQRVPDKVSEEGVPKKDDHDSIKKYRARDIPATSTETCRRRGTLSGSPGSAALHPGRALPGGHQEEWSYWQASHSVPKTTMYLYTI